jgi:hypothetical protein
LEKAKENVFPYPLRRIAHADINCFSTNGNIINGFLNKKAGAIYVRDDKLEIVTETPEKMIELSEKMFH